MEIIALSGATVAKLHDDEIGSMVESGSSVRDLKLLLANRIGFSRFQQGLLSEEIGELQDDMDLRPLPTTTGNPALCAPDETAKKELHRAYDEANDVAEMERLLQKPQNPNRGNVHRDFPPLYVAAFRGHWKLCSCCLRPELTKRIGW